MVKLETLPTVNIGGKVRVRVRRVMDAGFRVFAMTYTGLPYIIVQGSPARIWESKPRSDWTNIKKVLSLRTSLNGLTTGVTVVTPHDIVGLQPCAPIAIIRSPVDVHGSSIRHNVGFDGAHQMEQV